MTKTLSGMPYDALLAHANNYFGVGKAEVNRIMRKSPNDLTDSEREIYDTVRSLRGDVRMEFRASSDSAEARESLFARHTGLLLGELESLARQEAKKNGTTPRVAVAVTAEDKANARKALVRHTPKKPKVPKLSAAEEKQRQAHNRKLVISLADLGLYVHPCAPDTKRPIVPNWTQPEPDDIDEAKRLHADRNKRLKRNSPFVAFGCTNDPKRVAEIWDTVPYAIPGISLGPSRLLAFDGDIKQTYSTVHPVTKKKVTLTKKSGVYAIPFDKGTVPALENAGKLVWAEDGEPVVVDLQAVKLEKDDGAKCLLDLLSGHGELKDAPRVTSQSGGVHLYFDNSGEDPFMSGQGFDKFNIDVLGVGCQIIAPGSWRSDGARYVEHPDHGAIDDALLCNALPFVSEAVVAAVGLRRVSQGKSETKHGKVPEGFEIDNDAAIKRFQVYLRKCTPGSSSRHDQVKVMAGVAGDFGLSREMATELLLVANADSDCPFGAPLDDDDIEGFVSRMYDCRQNPIGCDAGDKRSTRDVTEGFGIVEDEKVTINYLHNDNEATIMQTVNALQDFVPLFTYGDRLVTVEARQLPAPATLLDNSKPTKPRSVVEFKEVTKEYLATLAGKHLVVTRTKPDGTMHRIAMPMREMDLLARNPQLYGIRPAYYLTDTPFLDSDGSIVTEEGYYKQRGIYLKPLLELPPIPAAPTKVEAQAALSVLDEVLAEFMFEDDASRSTAMSLILSLVFRNLLDTVPMHIITAPTPGSGKSELANAAVRIAFNADASAGGKGADEVELGKRLETLLSSGVQYILLDNVTGGLKGDVLCQAITQIEMQFRRLGSHTSVNVRGGRPIIATGNNLAVEEDIVRRSLRIGLDTKLERPEARTFKYDLRTFIRDKRPELLAAALTIGRAFILAAQKDRTLVLPAKPSGFTEWSAFVRSPLVWLGMADPVQTQVGLAAEDPAREVLAGVLRAWHLLSKGEPCTLADILKLSSNVLDTEAEEQDRVDRELALEKFKAACPNVKNGDLKSALGYYLRRHQNSPAAGLRISIADRDRANTTRWQTTDI